MLDGVEMILNVLNRRKSNLNFIGVIFSKPNLSNNRLISLKVKDSLFSIFNHLNPINKLYSNYDNYK